MEAFWSQLVQAAKSIHKSRMSAHLAQRVVWSHLDKKPFLAVSWSPVGESEASSSWRSEVVSPPLPQGNRYIAPGRQHWMLLCLCMHRHGCMGCLGGIPLLHGCCGPPAWLLAGVWVGSLLHGCWLVSGWVASLHGCWLVSGWVASLHGWCLSG